MTALENIRVIDQTQALAGPYCTQLLGDLGADVIKVERPGTGDQARGWGPPFLEGESAYFMSTNRNKRSITINLRDAAGQGIMRRLLERADVFVTNIPRLASLCKYGIDYETVHEYNSRLVYCAISGYGMTGPHAGRPGYDAIAQGEAGLMSLTGEIDGGPIRYPIPIADITAGMYSAMGIIAALYARERTGEGQFVDISLLESQMSWLSILAGNYFATDEVPQRLGNAHPNIVPYQPFRAKDKHIIIAAGSEKLWQQLCKVLEITDTIMVDARFATNRERLANRDVLIPILQKIIAQHDAAYWLERLRGAGIPSGAINTVPDALSDPQALARGMVAKIEHPLVGALKILGNPLHLSESEVTYRLPPPLLGEHNAEILRELGYDAAEIEELCAGACGG